MSELFVGIDNGLGGGIVEINSKGKPVSKQVTPTIKVKKGKSTRDEYDLVAMRTIVMRLGKLHLKHEKDEKGGQKVMVALEKGQPFPPMKASAKTNFSAGYCYGLWLAFLVAFKVPHVVVPARQWQHRMLQGVSGDTKQRSVRKAKQRHPSEDWRKSKKAKKPHDGITDAYWLAEYARKYES